MPAPRRHRAESESPNAKRLRFPSSEESGDFALEVLHQLFQCHLAVHLAAVRVDVCACMYVSICVRVRAREVRLHVHRTRIHSRAREHTHKIMYFESHPITHAPHQSISHHTPYDMKPQVYRIIASANVRIGLTDRNRGGQWGADDHHCLLVLIQ